MIDTEKKILDIVTRLDYNKGMNYDEDKIHLTSRYNNKTAFLFYVDSERTYDSYEIRAYKEKDEVTISCDCMQFYQTDSCKHVAAVLIAYSDIIFKEEKKDYVKISKNLFSKLKNEISSNNVIKQKVNVKVTFEFSCRDYYRYASIYLKVQIGLKKMYSLTQKLSSFMASVYNDQEYYFGKDFTYDPKTCYIDKEDMRFLEFINDGDFVRYSSITLNESGFRQLLNFRYENLYYASNTKFFVNEGLFLQSNLTKNDDLYTLFLDTDMNDIYYLTDDKNYVLYNGLVYKLDNKEKFLLNELMQNNLDKIVFNESDFKTFKDTLLPYVKKDIVIANDIDLVIPKEPIPKLYFDLNENNITLKLIFDYDGYEVDYTNNQNSKVLRDNEFENYVFNDIQVYGFIKDDDVIYLEDLDKLVYFVEEGLKELNNKYQVFTSEKMDSMRVNHNVNVSSTFHLGMDDILNYKIDVLGVDESEYEDLFKSLKLKKKYFRLKNGDVVDLESQELQELEVLENDLNINKTNGEIPKFRALYLDSLKKSSRVVKTDSSFDKFINNFNKNKECGIEFTSDEKELLRDYQLAGVNFLNTIHLCGFGGILADEMGLGKSLQTIKFIEKSIEDDDKYLIVCPTSLVYNWENEFKKFASNLNVGVFSGLKNERLKALENFKGNIYITSYGLLKEDFEFYKDINFKCFFIDEAQAIKNPFALISKTVKEIKAKTKFALTGTPLENSVTELWSIFDFIMPGFLGNLETFNHKYKINGEFDDDTKELLKRLKKQISPFMLRRKKVDVLKDLPDKLENNIYIDLEEEQKKIYALAVSEANKMMDDLVNTSGFTKNKIVILSLLTKLRQICIDPRIVYENYKNASSKITELIKVIKELKENGHKILLFTSFKTALNIVRSELDINDISSYVITGDVSSRKRSELVNKFNNDNTDVFLIMLKSGGTGLNLTGADTVIHLDMWWNPQAENQATDRAHRIGQKNTVSVIKLITKGTIEEKILKLQEQKKVLSDTLIENDDVDSNLIKDLTEKDIRELLSFDNK